MKTVFGRFAVRISTGTGNYFVFLLSHATNMSRCCLELGHDQFLSHNLQSSIYNHPDTRHFTAFFIAFFNQSERHTGRKYLFIFGGGDKFGDKYQQFPELNQKGLCYKFSVPTPGTVFQTPDQFVFMEATCSLLHSMASA